MYCRYNSAPLAFRFSCQWLSWLSWVHVCMHNYCPSNHSTGMSKSLCILSLGTVVCCITCHQILSQDPPTVYNLPTVTEGVSTHPEPLLLICSCIMEDTSWGCASSDVMPIPLISIKAHLEINVSSRLKRVQPAMWTLKVAIAKVHTPLPSACSWFVYCVKV